MNLEYGATYYRVTYADPKCSMPGLEPIVYIGENIFGDEKETTYYFQDTVSVLVFGRADETTDTEECCVSSCPSNELGTSIVDIDQASRLVTSAAEKSRAMGYPKLEKTKGEWKSAT